MSNKVLNATALMFGGNHEEAILELKNADMNRAKVLAMLLDCYLHTEQFDNAYIISFEILEKFSEYNLHETEYIYLQKARKTIKDYKNNKFTMVNRKLLKKNSIGGIVDKEELNSYSNEMISEIGQSVKDLNFEVIEGENFGKSGIRISFDFDDEKLKKSFENYDIKQKEKKTLELVNIINSIGKSEIKKLAIVLDNIKKSEILKLITVLYNSNSELKVEIDNKYIDSILLAAKEALNEGDFQKVIKIIKGNNLNDIMSQVLLADCYLMLGEFVIAVNNYEKIANTYSRSELEEDEYEYLDKVEQAIGFYKDIDFHEYDVNIRGKKIVQSVERSNESYPESDYYQSIINCMDENKKNKMIEDLFSEKVLTEPEEKERSYFALAEFYFGSDNNDDFLKAFGYYYEAIKLNPNKALYYGYAANSLYRYYIKKQISGEAKDELIYILGYRSSKFAKRAIELDPRNPRWYFYQNFALSSLIVHNPNFIRQAMKDNQTALSLCRSDQRVLKQAILKSSETLSSGMDLLGNAGVLVLEKPEEDVEDKISSVSNKDDQRVNEDNLKEKDTKNLNKTKESIGDLYTSDDLKEFSDTDEMRYARLTVYNRDFEKVVELLKGCDKENIKILYMLAESYMYSGQLDMAYDTYKKINYKLLHESNLRDNEIKYFKKAEGFIKFLRKYDYGSRDYNVRMKGEKTNQSIERVDGTYEESDYAFLYINGRSDSIRSKVLFEIRDGLDSISDSIVAISNFKAAEILYHSKKEFINAYGMYYQAAKLSPNKALYFGYASRALNRQAEEFILTASTKEIDGLVIQSSLIASKFARRAIELDFENPRWHLYQSKALYNLLRYNNNYIIQAEKEIYLALRLCRDDQEKLKKEIKRHKEYINSKKKYIKEEELVFYKERKLEVKRKEMIQNRINKYWEYNIKEKNKLEKEKNELENKIDTLNHQESLINEDRTIEELSESLKILNKEKTRIFIFKKRKEEIDLEIDKTANKIKKLNEEKNINIANIRYKIDCLRKRLIEIDNELTKER